MIVWICFSYFVSRSWGIPMMKITGLSHLFKWENLHNWWLTKYFFCPTVSTFFPRLMIFCTNYGSKFHYTVNNQQKVRSMNTILSILKNWIQWGDIIFYSPFNHQSLKINVLYTLLSTYNEKLLKIIIMHFIYRCLSWHSRSPYIINKTKTIKTIRRNTVKNTMQLWSKGVSYAEQMGFEFGFKMWERVNVTKVRREWVPKLGSRAAERVVVSNKTNRRNSEMNGRRWSECTNRWKIKMFLLSAAILRKCHWHSRIQRIHENNQALG